MKRKGTDRIYAALVIMILLTGHRRCICQGFAFSVSIWHDTSARFRQQLQPALTLKRSSLGIRQRRSLASATDEISSLEALVKSKGDEIREMKNNGADKATVAPLVAELLALKSKLEAASAPPASKKEPIQESADEDDSESNFITSRAVDYSKWYNDIIRVTGLAENSPVRGCMVIKPWGMALWESVRDELDKKIKALGVQNAYFPLLIPKSFLSKEAEHVDGFAKECAVVTHHRLTSDPKNPGQLIADPEALLEDPLIVRPTSETMIWYMFAKWIRSHRDLPLKLNQWANVMRWEMRTRPFLRTSEFLWQEGHTAHATAESAQSDAQTMIHTYAQLCQELLAMPVVLGQKSPSERFAGAEQTYTIEALMQNGWALQSGTSHFLGQSFGKAFNVQYQDESGKQQIVWGTSWGVSTRLLGALIMTHSDDAGLVLPPRMAPIQVVIVTIPPRKNDGEQAILGLQSAWMELKRKLEDKGVRVHVDDRDYIRPGSKYFEWERKGVPLRVELGWRDVQNSVCVLKYRATKLSAEKQTVPLDNAATQIEEGLQTMQEALYQEASDRLNKGITRGVATYDQMKEALENDVASQYPGSGLYLVPWKCDASNEAQIKQDCQATIRCYPLNEQPPPEGSVCFYSGELATHMALFGRAF